MGENVNVKFLCFNFYSHQVQIMCDVNKKYVHIFVGVQVAESLVFCVVCLWTIVCPFVLFLLATLLSFFDLKYLNMKVKTIHEKNLKKLHWKTSPFPIIYNIIFLLIL